MNATTILSRFESCLSVWEQALDQYSEADFARQPAPDAWSIGQVYEHLVRSLLRYHLQQAELCMTSDADAGASKKMPGRITYFFGGLLPVRVKVPPTPQYTPPQPESTAAVKAMFPTLHEKMAAAAELLSQPHARGKTAHPALGYLNALEWFALIEMHFRHHLRQKKRIDAFLQKQAQNHPAQKS